MAQPLSDQTRESIVLALESGALSQGAIARQYGVDASTVSRIARRYGLEPLTDATPKHLIEAHVRWTTTRRLGLLDQGFDKLESMLPDLTKPGELRDWFVSTGIAIDKARLESDLSTSNVAVNHNDKLTPEQRAGIREWLIGADEPEHGVSEIVNGR